MAGGRKKQRQRQRQRAGEQKRSPPQRPKAAGEHVQLQRKEGVKCSNCDETHTLLLSCDGKLSEHWATSSDNCFKPRLVEELGNREIVQIACGDHHSMALSRGGELFTWGQNAYGQLGVGRQVTLTPKPQLVKGLKGIPLAQIAAGGAHSIAVSLSGAVYSWGKNDFGQLGLGHTEDKDYPSYIEALEHWKTVFIACGADHTAVLSKDGLVCTFGAGGAGQLGHNSTRNELTPRVVAELWGARVSQVACGRQHTLVYVPSLDKVYLFGSDEGQLGNERVANQLIPLPINSPVDNGKFCQENNTSQKVIKTTSEEKESIVLCLKERNSYPLNGIATLKENEADAWISNSRPKRWKTIKKNIRLIFSSEACINGSFLEKRDKHFKTSKEISGVDMREVQCFYNKISNKRVIYQEVQSGIEDLLPSLSSSPISPENFRVYLILPFLLQGDDESSYCSLRLLAKAILRLQQKDREALECLWSNLDTLFFKNLVHIYQKLSQNTLDQLIRRNGVLQIHLFEHETTLRLHETLQILHILYQVNTRAGFRLQENNFYVSEVKTIIEYLFNVKQAVMFQRVTFQRTLGMLTKYPCIFDMQDKIWVHYLECNSLYTCYNFLGWIWKKPYTFSVRREHLLDDIRRHLITAQNDQFSRNLEVPSHDDTFFLIGTLFGMAFYNKCHAPFPFPSALFKKMLNITPTLEDLRELMPAVARNLQNILNEESEDELESQHMTFVQLEEGGSVVELKENGTNIPVTKHNRKEFVDLYVNYIFNESIRKPFEDFMQGFLRGCPARSWKMFLPVELRVALLGHATYNWRLLQKNVIYIGYQESHQTIKNFWTVFFKLPEEKKKKFLAFMSGSDRIPAYGLEYFGFAIQDPGWENPDNFFPRGRIHDLLKREKMLCWGYSSFGQPGIGSNLQVIIPEPQVYGFIHDRNVKEVACGGNHSVFLLEDGEVYTCGLNTKGQLGHESEGSKPEQIGALAGQHIVHVACGESHSVALSDQGQLFSWGAGSDGQLGLTTIEEAVTVPRLIKKLNQQTILQVSCGNWHCLALAADGQFFTWGQNSYGQLGLGAVFGWGKNSSGQLGLSDERDRESPCHVKLLRSQKVVYISCGEEHTAVLTKSGGVFTFGAGSCGQLGHDSMNDEVNPRRVLELMGSEVSQIACGRHHTLAFVPSSGMIYAFGCGTRGQLGTGHTCNVKCPSPVKGHWAAHNGQLSGKPDACKYHIVKHIFSGGDQTFVLCSKYENSLPADDFRTINETRYTCLINDETIDVWRQKLLEKNSSNSVNNVVQILSSAACWNGSFLEKKIDEHFKTSPKTPGIDLNSTRVLFEKLMNSQHSILLDQILKSFESFLIPQLSSSPPDVEAMRIYLILPEFPPFQDSKYYITLTLPLAMAILRLDTNPSKVLDNWWSQVCPRYFLRLVDLYKGAVVYLLSGRKTLLIPVLFSSYITAALRLLEKLHKVNQKVKHVEYDKFYIPEISSLVDIQEDYLMWFLHQAGMKVRPSIMQDAVTLCSYPFIFDAQAKTKMLQTDAELQMQVAINGANLQNVFMLLTLEPLLARSPFLVLHVRRSNLVGDALRELSIHSDIDLKKPLKVIFDGEEAVDAGGVTKEFFLLLLKELLNPIYGMFTYYPESNLLWFSDTCFVEHNWFHLIGIICGLAIYNFTVVDLHFPLALYKKLLNVKPCLEDLKELSPTEGRSLQQLLDYPGEDIEETFCLNFTICRESYGVTEQKNLIEDGDNILVQKDNREEFVEAYVNYIFNLSIHEWYTAFSTGFLKVCGGKVLELFQPTELRAMIVGNSNYNWEELEESAVYKGDYTATHPTVRMFWETFHAFPLEKKKKFLLFLTGSDRIPIYGMSSLRIVIQSTASGEQYLPVAHTCYNLLDLPKYSSKEILSARLVQAIDHYEGFSLA
uniref:HECT-type E3 ubiquitin transferase n=1 Tax=Anser cygnoides TaxID=8845 RepID=A0A8B9EEK2_ANSCY